jgi:FemAB-related protein (PEP-CTERM system-associated)
MVDIRVLTAPDAMPWSRALEAAPGARLGHAAEWARIIGQSYGHEPLYLATTGPGGMAVLPAFVVRRPLAGTVVTSMPFLDSGGPCGASPATAALLVARLAAEARARGARLVELRCAERLPIDVEPSTAKVNMTLALERDPGALWQRFHKSVRNQIRKAERASLTVEPGAAALPAFYDVFVERMRDLGSPVHAFGFLRTVVDAFGSRARVLVVKKGSTTVGGLVALAFGDRVVVPWAACSKAHFALCPNMLLYWETIQSACRDGAARFDFGRSTRLSGTYQFKRQWGAEEEPLFWYRIPTDGAAAAALSAPGSARDALASLWRRLPLPVTRHLGPRLRRYLIQ